MALDLRLASPERDKHAEGEQLACLHVDSGARVVVAEAVGRHVALDVQLVFGRRSVEFLNDIAADDLLPNGKALLRALLRRGRGLARQRQFDASFSEDIVDRKSVV